MQTNDLELLYEQMLLEKDHRKKMMKFGIPEDVAEYLHNFNDKYSLWFANQIKKMEGYQGANNKVNWIQTHLLTDMQGIVDWISNTPNTPLKVFDWKRAVGAQEKYHENLQTKTLEGEEKNKIIRKYPNEIYWVDLESNNCPEEGEAMGHCGRTDAETMFSLRKYDPKTQTIKILVTIAASPSVGEWRQAKGKKNSFPKEIYHNYIADILLKNGMLKYNTEWKPEHDFDANNLKEYIENNPEEFENPEELIENIEEDNVSFEDFEQVYNDMDMGSLKYYSVYLDNDYEEYIRHTAYFNFSIDLDKFGEYAINVERFIMRDNPHDGEDTQKSKDIMDIVLPHNYFNYVKVNAGVGLIEFGGDIQDDDDMSRVNDTGLDNFEKFCRYYQQEDSSFDEENAYEKFLEYLVDNDVIPDPENEEESQIIKPIPPEDPRQMKFDFSESFKQYFGAVTSQ